MRELGKFSEVGKIEKNDITKDMTEEAERINRMLESISFSTLHTAERVMLSFFPNSSWDKFNSFLPLVLLSLDQETSLLLLHYPFYLHIYHLTHLSYSWKSSLPLHLNTFC